jgi:outer membrane lipoprotein-sorting protein
MEVNMKIQKIILPIILFFFAGILSAQDAFEGKVIFEVQDGSEMQVMDYYAKDKKYRMEMPDKGGTIIFDNNKLMMYVLMDSEKMYIESQMMPLSMSGAGKVSKTGETKTILGHECEKFVFEQKDLSGEAWMTKDLGAFMFFMESQQDMPSWQQEIVDAGYFPLQVTQHSKRDNKTSVYNVIEVTPMDLSDDMFVVPPSYEKLDMTGLGGLEKLIGK